MSKPKATWETLVAQLRKDFNSLVTRAVKPWDHRMGVFFLCIGEYKKLANEHSDILVDRPPAEVVAVVSKVETDRDKNTIWHMPFYNAEEKYEATPTEVLTNTFVMGKKRACEIAWELRGMGFMPVVIPLRYVKKWVKKTALPQGKLF